jgi:hypothetical protein
MKIKTLPRQAPDKHRGKTHQKHRFSQVDLHIDLNERLWALTQRVFKKDDWTLQDGTLDFCRSSTGE